MNETNMKDRMLDHIKRAPIKSYFFKFPAGPRKGGIPDILGAIEKSDGETAYAIEAKVLDLPLRDGTMVDLLKGVTDRQAAVLTKMAGGGWTCYVAVLIRPMNKVWWIHWDRYGGPAGGKLVYTAKYLRDTVPPAMPRWFPTQFRASVSGILRKKR